MNDDLAAKQFIEVGFRSLLLAVLVMVLEAVSGSFAYTYWATVGLTGLTLAFTIGAIVGLGLLILVAVVAYLALRAIARREDHREEIETLQAQALLREQQPAPRPETLAVTTGVTIERVGNLIDRRDLEYFAEQIAATKDWTARRWENITLPHGYHITNRDGTPEHPTSYAKLIALFTDCKPPLIVERGDRKTGVLTVADSEQMVKRIVGSTRH